MELCDCFKKKVCFNMFESESGHKTERSKSYDEGIDNYQEEGRG